MKATTAKVVRHHEKNKEEKECDNKKALQRTVSNGYIVMSGDHYHPDQEKGTEENAEGEPKLSTMSKNDRKEREWRNNVLNTLDPYHELEKDELIDYL